MFVDDRIIARQGPEAGALCAIAHADTVTLRDGSTTALHLVQAGGRPMPGLRAVATASGALQLVDLTRLVRSLDAELRTCPRRDVAGLVMFLLRDAFATGVVFAAACTRVAAGTWLPVPGGFAWQRAARAVDPDVLRMVHAQASAAMPVGAPC